PPASYLGPWQSPFQSLKRKLHAISTSTAYHANTEKAGKWPAFQSEIARCSLERSGPNCGTLPPARWAPAALVVARTLLNVRRFESSNVGWPEKGAYRGVGGDRSGIGLRSVAILRSETDRCSFRGD